MKVKSVKCRFTILFLFGVSAAYADISQKITCPPLEIVKKSADQLDTAMKVNDKYIAYTASSFFQSNNLWWFSGVGNIAASSSQQAILLGQGILKNANIQIDVYANKVGNEFICNYGPGYIQARGKNIA